MSLALTLITLFTLAYLYWLWLKLKRNNQPDYHYCIISSNNQQRIEWYVRYIDFLRKVQGRNIILTVVDIGSTDDTKSILNKFWHYTNKIDHLYLLNSEEEANLLPSILTNFAKENSNILYIDLRSKQVKKGWQEKNTKYK